MCIFADFLKKSGNFSWTFNKPWVYEDLIDVKMAFLWLQQFVFPQPILCRLYMPHFLNRPLCSIF
jgi:hypothetical protein